MAATVLLVEDEVDLLDTVEFNLQREGYLTRRATSGRAGLEAAALDPIPGVVLLDLMLPDMSGTEVCRKLRESARTRAVPIIMLTAKAGEVDRIVGFEVGADDYVTKPFSMHELMLRVRAILRRASAPPPVSEIQRMGVLVLDSAAHRVLVHGKEVRLTALEFRLLTTLAARAGRVQTRDMLLSDVWDMHAGLTTRTVDTHVTRLRKKLGEEAGAYIETRRGIGYRFLEAQEIDALSPSPTAKPGSDEHD